MKNINKRGKIFVISGPSGVGKGTLLALLLKKHPEIHLSVSATTRKPRQGEQNGVNYLFLTKEEFQSLIDQEKFLEWAEFAGNYYGTYISTVEEALNQGKDIALEIEVQGAMQIKEKIKDAILIFILPPSTDELETRLRGRNTEADEVIERRLGIFKSELEKKDYFDYEVINDDLDTALKRIDSIIKTEKAQ